MAERKRRWALAGGFQPGNTGVTMGPPTTSGLPVVFWLGVLTCVAAPVFFIAWQLYGGPSETGAFDEYAGLARLLIGSGGAAVLSAVGLVLVLVGVNLAEKRNRSRPTSSG
ncbi:MAG: hypothetical protein OEW42_13635 [Acidimicrobiia bacterium]|nr:hypothetical protein [Acidimicrobiia bacterium]